MHDWESVQLVLEEQKINDQDEKILEKFLLSLGFQERQRIMGVLLGFPTECIFFIDLLKKKEILAKNKDDALKDEIMRMEKDFMKKILIDAQK